MNTADIADQATAALALALEEPRAASVLAHAAQVAAHAAGMAAEEAVALRALGLAARALQEITAARHFLAEAVDCAHRSGDDDLEAECRISLAAALVLSGEGTLALATLDAASPGRRVGVTLASQRAGILTMLGRYEEALACYDPVVRALRRSGERLLESNALSNRGLLHVYTGRFHHADLDLARAERLIDGLGYPTEAAGCAHNRGFAAARRGDLPAALALFDRAERRYVEAGVPLGEGAIDQAEALLAAGLVGDARQLLQRSIVALRAGGDWFAVAEGLILLADATHLGGDFEASGAAAAEAVGLFADQQRLGWHALASAALGRAALGQSTQGQSALGQSTQGQSALGYRRVPVAVAEAASEAAAALDRLGWATRALAAHAVAGKLWLEAGDGPGHRGRVGDELTRAASGRRRGPAADRAVAWDAEAVRRLTAGDRRGALVALKAAVAVVDAQQAGLSATELRAHISVHADSSAALGLRLAIESGRPRQILDWMERRRANSLRSWPVRPPRDPALAADLAELRRLAEEVAAAATSGEDPRPAASRAARLERSVRAQAWRLGADGSVARRVATPTPGRIAAELGGWALVELADSGGELHAVVVSGGRVAHRHLGATAVAARELEHLRFGLRRAAYGMAEAQSTSLVDSARRLDRLLLAPLTGLIGDRPVVVVPTGALHAVPWSALPTLAGRALTVAPSAHAWLRAVGRAAPDGPLLGVAGPGLPAAAAEVKALRRIYPTAELLTGRRATVTAVLARLEGAAVAAIAAHTKLSADSGMWSALQLADGPLTVYELEGLARAPGLVILSACQSGLSTVRSGDEVLGLVASLLALGSRTVVASVLPVDDHATMPLMLALHARLAAGDPPTTALAAAQAGAADAVVAASFVCFGAP